MEEALLTEILLQRPMMVSTKVLPFTTALKTTVPLGASDTMNILQVSWLVLEVNMVLRMSLPFPKVDMLQILSLAPELHRLWALKIRFFCLDTTMILS